MELRLGPPILTNDQPYQPQFLFYFLKFQMIFQELLTPFQPLRYLTGHTKVLAEGGIWARESIVVGKTLVWCQMRQNLLASLDGVGVGML